jgi:diguanylate cyclase (GGDEF)-like protein/PAS domain S-box-containing protein
VSLSDGIPAVRDGLLEPELLDAMFTHAPIGMATVGLGGVVERANAALCTMFGMAPGQVEGRKLGELAHPEDRPVVAGIAQRLVARDLETYEGQLRGRHVDGTTIWVGASAAVLSDATGRPTRMLVQLQDVTAQRRFEAQLQHMADHDGLTGLLNRRAFELELARHLRHCSRYGPSGALLLLDVDNFKYVNDALGHSAGDELIILIADVLRNRLRTSDVLARLGGDEFAVLLPRATLAEAMGVAEDIVVNLRGHARGRDDGRLRPVTASVGVAAVKTAMTGDELLADADLAMYDAKEAGRNQAAAFSGPDQAEPAIKSRMRWMERIENALADDGFVLHAQPIVDLASLEVVEHELLLRMVDPSGELISPGAFLPVAERFGLVERIDRWVVQRATAMAADGLGPFSLNLSAKSLADPGLVEFIAGCLQATGCDPSALTFEITETAAVTNVGLARALAEGLHDLGCSLSLDDFGAGFGSFYYLKHLPFDVLKIDGEFIAGCTTSKTDQLVIDAVVRVARGLGKTTVAEFTQDPETVELLRSAGVDLAQGFHLGRPVPASSLRPAGSTPAARGRRDLV